MTTASVQRDGDYAVIRLPISEVHALRVALHPVPAGAPTSTSTQSIRDRLDKALARLEAQGGR
jgi:hypothetical protein